MDCKKIIGFMDQQLSALKELEELTQHNDKEGTAQNVSQEDIESLKTYVETMKMACNTAVTLAKHYDSTEKQSTDKKSSTSRKKKDEKPVETPDEIPEDDELDFLL